MKFFNKQRSATYFNSLLPSRYVAEAAPFFPSLKLCLLTLTEKDSQLKFSLFMKIIWWLFTFLQGYQLAMWLMCFSIKFWAFRVPCVKWHGNLSEAFKQSEIWGDAGEERERECDTFLKRFVRRCGEGAACIFRGEWTSKKSFLKAQLFFVRDRSVLNENSIEVLWNFIGFCSVPLWDCS